MILDEFYSERTDSLRGQREPRAHAILATGKLARANALTIDELHRLKRVAYLHCERHHAFVSDVGDLYHELADSL